MHVLAGVDLNLLVALHALLEENSVTAAAKRVGITQPAMSHALGRLRVQFDDPLLVRSGRSMQPTPRALGLLAQVRPVVTQIDGLLNTVSPEPSAFAMTFRVVADDYVGCTMLPRVLARVGEVAPDVEVDVLPRGRPGRKRLLRQGEADVALGYFSSAGMDLSRSLLFEDPWVCVLRDGHPALAEPFTEEVWAGLRHVIVSPTGGRRGEVDRRLQLRELRRRVPIAVPHFSTAVAVVAATDAVLTTPSRLVAGRSDVVVVPPPVPMEDVPVYMLWHPRTEHDPAQRWFRELVVGVESRQV